MRMRRETFHIPFGRCALAVALVGGLLLATPVWAQTTVTNRINQKIDISGVVANPCVPENVPFDGFAHIVATTRVQPDGTIHVTTSDKFTGQGVGEVTQVKYTVGGTTNTNAKFPQGPFNLRETDRAISQGPTQNFFLVVVLHFNGQGELIQATTESFCRGQA